MFNMPVPVLPQFAQCRKTSALGFALVSERFFNVFLKEKYILLQLYLLFFGVNMHLRWVRLSLCADWGLGL